MIGTPRPRPLDPSERIARLRHGIEEIECRRDELEAAGRGDSGLLQQQWRLEDELGRVLFDAGRTFCGHCQGRYGPLATKEEDGIQCGLCGEVTEYRDLEERAAA